MKKKMKKILSLAVTLVMSAMMLLACGAEEAADITVTFMNGEKELGKVTAKAGEVLSDYAQFETVENAEFLGWYETPTFLETSLKDLTTDSFEADTVLYGSFKNTNVAEDARLWYVVGAGTSPVLSASNWAGSVDDSVKTDCQLVATGNATNEFAITLDMYAGDQFQVIHDWGWDGQKGFGAFTSIDEAQMENGGGLGGSAVTSNVNVLMDGNYTITLTTDPDNAAQDTLTIVRNGDASAAAPEKEETEEPAYVVNENTSIVVKGSWVSDWSENKDLERVDGTNTFKITMDLDAGIELYFMVWDNGEDTGLGMNGSNVADDGSRALLEDAYNVKVLDAGTYTFTVDADKMEISVSK